MPKFIYLLGWVALLLGSSSTSIRHEFHISKGLVSYVAAEQQLQITLHLFIDDLEESFRRAGINQLFLGTEREDSSAPRHLEAYLRRHFELTLNGQPTSWRFVGKEPGDDLQSLWCYLEVTGVAPPRQLRVRYDVLLDVYPDQKNILNVSVPGRPRTTLLFERDNTVKMINFE